MLEMTIKRVTKQSVRAALMISMSLIMVSFILAFLSRFLIHSSAGLMNYVFWVAGILMNVLFLNSVGDLSAKLIILFLITLFVTYHGVKKRLKKLDVRWSLVYMMEVSLVVALIVSLFTYLASLMLIPEFSSDQVVFRQQPLLTFVRTFFHQIIVLAGIKLYLMDEARLNTGLIAFKRYFYYVILFTFIISVVAEVYLFQVVAELDLFVKYANIGLIAGIFNVMAYILLLIFGGVAKVAIEFVNNREVFVLSFVDILQGEYGLGIVIFFVVSLILLLLLIGWTARRIEEAHYIRDAFIFGGAVILFNSLLVLLSGIDLDLSFARITIGFDILPMLVTSLVILFVVLIIRYMILLIKKSI